MKPQNEANNPISKNRYLNYKAAAIPGPIFLKGTENKHKKAPTRNKTEPWPKSPNITPNKKGKVTHVNTVGLTSLYDGVP